MSTKPPTALPLPKKPAPPATPKKIRQERQTTATLVRRLSEDSVKSPMGPDYVTLETTDQDGKLKRVYVTEVNGTRTLDLYSGWNPELGEHKFPLRMLPPKVCTLSNLQRLWVSHNLLSSLPADLDRLVSLKELFLHANKFKEFPMPLCTLKSLEILWLSNNAIESIPDEVSQLRTLKRLHLDGNLITELTSSVCTLTSLEVLYLNQNELGTVSEDIGNLTGLRRLYLQDNKITEIPSGLCSLKFIKMLFLDDNEICQIPSEFKTFKLERESNGAKISLENNPFSFSTPQNKSKLSLTNIHHLSLKARRHSDQHEQDYMSRRPLRVSLPGPRSAESLPAELHLHRGSVFGSSGDYKAETLPRSGSLKTRRSTYHEQ